MISPQRIWWALFFLRWHLIIEFSKTLFFGYYLWFQHCYRLKQSVQISIVYKPKRDLKCFLSLFFRHCSQYFFVFVILKTKHARVPGTVQATCKCLKLWCGFEVQYVLIQLSQTLEGNYEKLPWECWVQDYP